MCLVGCIGNYLYWIDCGWNYYLVVVLVLVWKLILWLCWIFYLVLFFWIVLSFFLLFDLCWCFFIILWVFYVYFSINFVFFDDDKYSLMCDVFYLMKKIWWKVVIMWLWFCRRCWIGEFDFFIEGFIFYGMNWLCRFMIFIKKVMLFFEVMLCIEWIGYIFNVFFFWKIWY